MGDGMYVSPRPVLISWWGDTRNMSTEILSGEASLSFGLQARVRRVSRLLTQRELAEIAGVSPEEVNMLEDGCPLPPEVEVKLARQLGIGDS